MTEFRERLYQLRKARGLSQEELANIVGVSRQAVQKWEAGTSRPDMDNLDQLSQYFGVSLDYLVRGREPEPPQLVPTEVHYHTHISWEYEYVSPHTLFGLPLVHINVGYGLRRARGVLAIGNVAAGFLAIGGFSAGLISLGGFSVGLLALGGLAAGGFALGGLAVGLAAWGGGAFGLLAIGGAAVGQYAAGGAVYGNAMAVGGAAGSAHVAVGVSTAGAAELRLSLADLAESGRTIPQVAAQIAPVLPHTPEWLIRFLLRFGL